MVRNGYDLHTTCGGSPFRPFILECCRNRSQVMRALGRVADAGHEPKNRHGLYDDHHNTHHNQPTPAEVNVSVKMQAPMQPTKSHGTMPPINRATSFQMGGGKKVTPECHTLSLLHMTKYCSHRLGHQWHNSGKVTVSPCFRGCDD